MTATMRHDDVICGPHDVVTTTATPVDKPPTWDDAYTRHVTLVLSSLLFERKDFRHVFSTEEVALATRFLVDFQPLAQHLYARLLQRQGGWVKTTSLFRYFIPYNEIEIKRDELLDKTQSGHEQLLQSVNNTDVQPVVRVMLDAGFIEPFPVTNAASRLPHMATFADQHRFHNDKLKQEQELATLDTVLTAVARCASSLELSILYKKMTGSNKKHGTKVDLMAAVRNVAKTQKRIDGSRIPVAQLMQQIWLESYPLAGKQLADVMVLRLTPATRDLMLRMHRLFYFVSTPPFNMASLLSVQLEDGRQLLAFAAEKLRQEPTQWPGLMVSFQKIVYPTYDVTKCSDVHDSDAQIRSAHPVFASSEAYVCYEVAYQLHRIMSVVKQCLCISPPEKQYEESDLELKWMLVDAPPVFLAFQRLLSVCCEEEKNTIKSEDEDVVLVVNLANEEDRASENWQMRSWEQFYRGVEMMESLDDLVLASRGCLQTYLAWMKKGVAYSLSDVPIYFSKCNAGYHLVRILHIAVGLYEKMRKYQIATLLLNDLLAAPFLERKRGYWWDRLALNLEHMKCSTQAIDTCMNALEDPHVLAADRIAVERRLHRLRRQCARQEEHRIESSSSVDLMLQSTGTSFLVPLVVISDDDEENKEKTVPAEVQCTYQYHQDHIVGRPLNCQTGEKSRFVGYDDEPCTVEQLVLQYYRDHCSVNTNDKQAETGGWYGVHSEGFVLRNLFGIFMWDVLYASIPDVFQTPFQSGPLDFGYADVFYEARRDLVNQRISQVQETWTMGELLTAFLTRWDAEFGKVTRFVHWPSDEGASLKFHMLTIAAIGRMELANLLRYMATSKEYHQARNGLPDLLLLRIKLSSREAGHDLETSQWVVDSHDCLNVYAFCGMDEHLNMNEKTRSSVEVLDETKPLSAEKLDVLTVKTVLQLVQDSCAARLKCVEVKGPRDRLSDKQLLWLQVLNEEVCLDASVMQVEEPEKRAKRKMKKKKKEQSEANTVSRKKRSTGRR